MKQKIGIALCIFHEVRFFRKLLGKILHPSKQSLSQFEDNFRKSCSATTM